MIKQTREDCERALTASVRPHSVNSFFRNDWNMTNAAIGSDHHNPNPAFKRRPTNRIADKYTPEIRLPRVSMHRSTSKFSSDPPLCPSQKWHDNERGHRPRQFRRYCVQVAFCLEGRKPTRILRKPRGQGSTRPRFLGQPFISFPTPRVRVNRHPPEENSAGRYFYEAVDSEANE